MTSAAARAIEALQALIREASPANGERPRWVLLRAEAKRRGHPSTRAFRAWCTRHGVTIRQGEGERDGWVQPVDVDRAVDGLPAAAAPTTDDPADRWLAGTPRG